MKSRTPITKWIKVILIILIASLLYVVYFTELGKPPPQNEPTMIFSNQTAVPTIFAQWSPVPVIELDRAYADQNLLKVAITVHNLEMNMDPYDWICNPQISIDKPVSHRLRDYEMTSVYETSGVLVRATYEYDINAGDYNALTVNMAIFIGPCPDYLDFRDIHVTSFNKPEPVGNYHLNFQIPVKPSTPTPSLSSTPILLAPESWRGLPIFPGSIEANDLPADYPVYHYIIENADIDAVKHFYEEQMQIIDWKLLGFTDTSGVAPGKSYSLWFAKDQDTVTIDVFMKGNTIRVFIRLG